MAGIQIGGIASGMDTESIITQLMSIESAPRTRTARQQVTVQARQDALRQIDTKLTNLKLAAGDLRSASIWTPTQAISSGNESVLTARQLTGAAPGGYTVERRLAGQRRLAHLPVERGGGSLTDRLQDRRQRAEQDLRPDRHEHRRCRVHHQQRRQLARLGRQRRRQAVALAPRHRRPRQLGLRRLRAGHRRADRLARRRQRVLHGRRRLDRLHVAHERRHRRPARHRADASSRPARRPSPSPRRPPTPPTSPPSSRPSSAPTTTPSTSCAAS